MLTQEIREQLRKPLPAEAISQHPTKTFLSTIKAIYVVERLNDVFGIGGWFVKNEVIKEGEKWIIMKATLTVPAHEIEIEQFGGNDNADPGDAYKGAATDALTKIGSYLEIGIDVFKGKHDKLNQPPYAKPQAKPTASPNAQAMAQAKKEAVKPTQVIILKKKLNDLGAKSEIEALKILEEKTGVTVKAIADIDEAFAGQLLGLFISYEKA